MHLSQVEFLRHIIHECQYLEKECSQNTFKDFLENERLCKAICRSLEIIGEACSKIHPDIKKSYPFVPWREMGDIRNKIIHHYFGIDYDIVWSTINVDIPSLKNDVTAILEHLKK